MFLLNLSLAAWSDNEDENVDWGIGTIIFTFRRSRKSDIDNQHSKRRISPGKTFRRTLDRYFKNIQSVESALVSIPIRPILSIDSKHVWLLVPYSDHRTQESNSAMYFLYE